MIVGKDYWLTEKDISTCVEAGAVFLFTTNFQNTTSLEDILVLSTAAASKGFLRKNPNAIKIFVYRGETASDLMCFRKEQFTFGKFDNTNVEKILVINGSKFTLIDIKD